MNKSTFKTFLLAIMVAVFFSACSNDDNDDTKTNRRANGAYELSVDESEYYPYEWYTFDYRELFYCASKIPCKIETEEVESELRTSSTRTQTTWLLNINGDVATFKTESNQIDTISAQKLSVTTYTFQEGNYVVHENDYDLNVTVTSNLINWGRCCELQDYKFTDVKVLDEEVFKSVMNNATSEMQTLNVEYFSDDHFALRNSTHLFECYITAKGCKIQQLKPIEREIGVLEKK